MIISIFFFHNWFVVVVSIFNCSCIMKMKTFILLRLCSRGFHICFEDSMQVLNITPMEYNVFELLLLSVSKTLPIPFLDQSDLLSDCKNASFSWVWFLFKMYIFNFIKANLISDILVFSLILLISYPFLNSWEIIIS